MNQLFERMDARVRERSLLGHPFYRAWSAGELSRDALAEYAREYFQLVQAVPAFMDTIIERAPTDARAELREQRDEEAEHAEPWQRFARAFGIQADALDAHDARAETTEAIAMFRQALGDTFEQGAAAMYALELEIPAIAVTKMEGLETRYGMTSDDALDYFRLHSEADVRHAAAWRELLAASGAAEDTLMAAADRSLDAQHRLLDGCYQVHLRTKHAGAAGDDCRVPAADA